MWWSAVRVDARNAVAAQDSLAKWQALLAKGQSCAMMAMRQEVRVTSAELLGEAVAKAAEATVVIVRRLQAP